MIVARLTIEQKDQLVGKEYTTDCFFNPIQDGESEWIISREEVDHCDVIEFDWVKDLDFSEFIEPVDPFNE